MVFLGTLSLLCVACRPSEPAVYVPPPPSDLEANIEFKSYAAHGFPEQDAYVETHQGSRLVMRFDSTNPGVEPETASLIFRRSVFGSATARPHDPYKTLKVPDTTEKGRPIGVALVTWDFAHAWASYESRAGEATLQADFGGLIRGGTYSLWCVRMSTKAVVQKPCSIALPPIVADHRGDAEVQLSFPAMPDSTTETGSWLMLAYHSDGHQEPLEHGFGLHTHAQVLARLPQPAELRPAY